MQGGERPLGFREVAALLREEIRSGRLRPGDRVPSERDMPQVYGIAIETGRRAIRLLASEGLVVVQHGHPTRVAGEPERTEVRLPRGARWWDRPATPEELDEYGTPGVIEVDLFGRRTVYAGGRHTFTIL